MKTTKPKSSEGLKLKLEVLMSIEKCLREVLLPVKETELDFEINKNVYRLGRKIDAAQSELSALKEKFYIRDDNGKPKKFIATPVGKNLFIYKKDESGNEIEVDKSYSGPSLPLIKDDNKEYEKAKEKFDNEEIEISLCEFPEDQVIKCFKSGKFSGLDLSPLFPHLIKDDQ